ncbi:MAG: EamA/RhaT family transporter [Acidobacteriaceae bacterium]|nr:EamA/RhaT family transporter [Acidobacteriaceae bacterium]MBV8570190.1 EamA/RhaT family transporter [Acidobacteriaceae bacterium]
MKPAERTLSGELAKTAQSPSRQRTLHRLGIFCGFAAAIWLAAAEAPTKLVTISVSPIVISFMMVLGAFVSRWSLPALVRGTGDALRDARHVPHLVVWGVMAGCLWAVGNTLTIFAVRDIGLSLAFPLWNSNSLIGILWGTLLFRELHRANWMRKMGVVGGAVIIFIGAVLISAASTSEAGRGNAVHGIAAAIGAGLMFGSMYIPYRKAYITGMNPLTFLTFFTFGEMTMMTAVALVFTGGVRPFWHDLAASRGILLWPMLGGFMWVVGDIFQNYATKYVGISRGIPLSNTNQLWGLLLGLLVFRELQGLTAATYVEVIGGSLLMALGAVSISTSSTSEDEYGSWKQAAQREVDLYGINPEYVSTRMEGRELESGEVRRTWVDWLLITGATLLFIGLATVTRVPQMDMRVGWLAVFALLLAGVLVAGVAVLWRVTKFT